MFNYLWFFIGGEDIAHMVQANRQINKILKKTLKIGSNFSLIFIKWFLIVPFEEILAFYLFSNVVTVFFFFEFSQFGEFVFKNWSETQFFLWF
jgi:hypothetical protein